MNRPEPDEMKQAVHEIVRRIPAGRATSYGAIARAVGWPDHARLVGRIMAAVDSACSGIPAHRVVDSQGRLSGRTAFDPPTAMQEQLEAEGVPVRNHRITGWKHVFWDPVEEL